MNNLLIYTIITVAYIVLMLIYFSRRSKSHEVELTTFLDNAKEQLELHKVTATQEANQKVALAVQVIKKVQAIADQFEKEAQKEYDQIIKEAKEEKREIIASAKADIESLFVKAEGDLEEFRQRRLAEIEKNLVKMVVAVTEKVVQTGFDAKQHKELIYQCLDEIKQQQQRG